jgi:hypothetical protein
VGADVVTLGIAALAVVPVVVALFPNLPMTVRPVTTPRWFSTVGPHLQGDPVVLPYPAALGGIQSSMVWQASAGMTFSMVGGGGPGITPSRAGKEAPGFGVLARASLPLTETPDASTSNLDAIRRALIGWGVTTVVVPDQPGLPTYDRGRSVGYAVALFTAALGRPPGHQADAWVWTRVGDLGAPIPMTAGAFTQCTDSDGADTSGVVAASCVLHAR